MKRISKIYKNLLTLLAVLLFASSCTDYLTIIPPDKTTEEFYWQTEDDVNGVLAKAYLNLLSTDAIKKAIVWGELRSETLTIPTNPNSEIKYVVEANLFDDNSYCNWAIYYEAIQTANLVIDRAQYVLERDPDFTQGDCDVVIGEMYALRALAHFYLVRAFRDIPMALEVVDKDYNMPLYSQVHPLVALNHIMADLDKAQGLVMKSGSFVNLDGHNRNLGRITENAVLAMKADVNLWRAAFAQYHENNTELVGPNDVQKYYDDCINDCRTIVANMDRMFEAENKGNKGNKESYPYNLIQNEGGADLKKLTKWSTAFDDIFGDGNSSESIFELQVTGTNATNGFALGTRDMYGASGTAYGYDKSLVIVPKDFHKNYSEDDLRAYSFLDIEDYKTGKEEGSVYVCKYKAVSSPASLGNYRNADNFAANWIVYRKTDVLLMMAEALTLRPSSSGDDYLEAFNIVKAINTRSRMDTLNIKKPLDFNKYNNKETLHELVLKERLLELSFEGKRWFDLVRKALREKDTKNILFVAKKLDNGAGAVQSKMATIDGLFMPIHIDELRYNKNLKQNPVYTREDSSTEMN